MTTIVTISDDFVIFNSIVFMSTISAQFLNYRY